MVKPERAFEIKMEEDSLFDRRLHPRIKAELSAVLSTNRERIVAQIIDITTEGAALRMPAGVLGIGDTVTVQFAMPRGGAAVSATGVICSLQSSVDKTCKVGVRFIQIPLEFRNLLSEWFAIRLKDRSAIDDRRTKNEIISRRVEFRNRRSARIIGVVDALNGLPSDAPWAILPPAYGETKTSVLITSYYLARNGFHCLRYDATNHTGESDGEIMHWSLRSMADDLQSAINYLEKEYGVHRTAVAAYSMAARAAIKAAAEDPRISTLVTLVGVVDLQATLKKAYKEDLIGTYMQGKRWGITEVLGFQVDLSSIEAAISGSFHSLQTTIEDLKKTKAKIVQIVTEHDLWVNLQDVRETVQAVGCEIKIISGAFHQLSENPAIAKLAMRTVVQKCLESECGKSVPLDSVHEPMLREIALQSRIEKEILRNLNSSFKEKEVEFWEKYLSSFDFILRSHDYQQLYEIAMNWLPARDKHRFLDAGCGVGNFIIWLLNNFSERQNVNGDRGLLDISSVEYVGLDYVETALSKAKQRLKTILGDATPSTKLAGWSFVYGDLNKRLSFEDNFFDFCCGNMVLSYVDDPLFTLREFYRITSPGGRLFLTSLKHSPDLGVIFNEFAKDAQKEDLEKARELLNNAGGIRHRVSQGYFRFFSAGELERLMHYAGFVNVHTMPVILNQGIMIAGEKK